MLTSLPPAPDTTVVPVQPPEFFTVITRGVEFKLSRGQIEFDSPNYFTAAFLEHDFQEATTRVLHTDRHPQLFALIVEHLSGYRVLPLQSPSIPITMSLEMAKVNLARDAEYFGLERLQTALAPPPRDWDSPYSVFKDWGLKDGAHFKAMKQLDHHDFNDMHLFFNPGVDHKFLTQNLGLSEGAASLILAGINLV
jgi:hypothetical protein